MFAQIIYIFRFTLNDDITGITYFAQQCHFVSNSFTMCHYNTLQANITAELFYIMLL